MNYINVKKLIFRLLHSKPIVRDNSSLKLKAVINFNLSSKDQMTCVHSSSLRSILFINMYIFYILNKYTKCDQPKTKI